MENIKPFISAFVLVLVTVGASFGISIDQDALVNAILVIVDAAAVVYACWKNHNFTKAAKMGQAVTDKIKAEKAMEEEVE